jgi:peptide/nickel transport system substrate-binding protein
LVTLVGCQPSRDDARTVVVAIENSPNSLDPRVGTDAMAERIGGLLFDALVKKDEHFQMQPWLATSWQQPDPLTWVFHLRDGVRFQDGRPLTADDVAYTVNSLVDGSLVTSKSGAFARVLRAEARDRLTVTIRMNAPDASLLFNLSDGLFGVVPKGSGKNFGLAPVGSGPFRFVSAEQDKEVVVERNADYWAGAPKIERVRFAVVPDAVTVALELEKGSVDIASNELTLDMVHALETRRGLKIETAQGSPVMYLNFNVASGPLADERVRQAVACAIDRQAIVDAVWRGHARLADTLGGGSGAFAGAVSARHHSREVSAGHRGLRARASTGDEAIDGRDYAARRGDSSAATRRRQYPVDAAFERVRNLLLGCDRRSLPDVCAALDRLERGSGHLSLCLRIERFPSEGRQPRTLLQHNLGCAADERIGDNR